MKRAILVGLFVLVPFVAFGQWSVDIYHPPDTLPRIFGVDPAASEGFDSLDYLFPAFPMEFIFYFAIDDTISTLWRDIRPPADTIVWRLVGQWRMYTDVSPETVYWDPSTLPISEGQFYFDTLEDMSTKTNMLESDRYVFLPSSPYGTLDTLYIQFIAGAAPPEDTIPPYADNWYPPCGSDSVPVDLDSFCVDIIDALSGVSMAVARASAEELGVPLFAYLGGVNAHILPVPQMNVINGGAHADNNLEIQEFMIVPAGFDSFSAAYQAGSEIYHTLKKILKERGLSTAVGDEGGFAPNLKTHAEALEILVEAIEKTGYKPGEQVFLAIDAAASEFFKDGKYQFEGKPRTSGEMIEYYRGLIDKFPIVSIEDGLAEGDWEGWAKMRAELGDRIQIVGDDIFVTNPKMIARGIEENVANAVLIKLNQIGTVTETLQAVEMAHRAGWNTVISHRSGETADTFIADLAVAVNSGQIKTGAPCRIERVEKYNQLLRIEEFLDEVAEFPEPKKLYKNV